MIELNFANTEAAKIYTTLIPYQGAKIIVQTKGNGTIEGLLDVKSKSTIVVTDQQSRRHSIAIHSVTILSIKTGGDWTTARGHAGGAKTERIHIRCTSEEKRKLAVLAQRKSIGLSALLREAAMQLIQDSTS